MHVFILYVIQSVSGASSPHCLVQITPGIYNKFCNAFDLYQLIKLLWKINGVQSCYELFFTYMSVANGEVYLSQSLERKCWIGYKSPFIWTYKWKYKRIKYRQHWRKTGAWEFRISVFEGEVSYKLHKLSNCIATLMRCILIQGEIGNLITSLEEREKKMEACFPLSFIPKVIFNCPSRGHVYATSELVQMTVLLLGKSSPGTSGKTWQEWDTSHIEGTRNTTHMSRQPGITCTCLGRPIHTSTGTAMAKLTSKQNECLSKNCHPLTWALDCKAAIADLLLFLPGVWAHRQTSSSTPCFSCRHWNK